MLIDSYYNTVISGPHTTSRIACHDLRLIALKLTMGETMANRVRAGSRYPLERRYLWQQTGTRWYLLTDAELSCLILTPQVALPTKDPTLVVLGHTIGQVIVSGVWTGSRKSSRKAGFKALNAHPITTVCANRHFKIVVSGPQNTSRMGYKELSLFTVKPQRFKEQRNVR